MKKKISRILGVVLTLALLSSLAIVSAPVSADVQKWDVFATPSTTGKVLNTTIASADAFAQSPVDGALYAAVTDAGVFTLLKSIDGGRTWKSITTFPSVVVPAVAEQSIITLSGSPRIGDEIEVIVDGDASPTTYTVLSGDIGIDDAASLAAIAIKVAAAINADAQASADVTAAAAGAVVTLTADVAGLAGAFTLTSTVTPIGASSLAVAVTDETVAAADAVAEQSIIALSGSPRAGDVIEVIVAGDASPTTYTVLSGDIGIDDAASLAAIAIKVAAAINADAEAAAVVTATAATSVVTLTADVAGLAGAFTLTSTVTPIGASSLAVAVDDNTTPAADAVAQVDTITPTAVLNTVYTLRINPLVGTAVDFTYTSSGAPDAAEIVNAFVALIEAHATISLVVDALNVTDTLQLTADVAGTAGGFTTADLGPGVLAIVNTTAAVDAVAEVSTVTLSGSPRAGDVIEVIVDGDASPTTYTVLTGDTLDDIATAVADAINADAQASADVTAAAAGAVVTLTADVAGTGGAFTLTSSVTGITASTLAVADAETVAAAAAVAEVSTITLSGSPRAGDVVEVIVDGDASPTTYTVLSGDIGIDDAASLAAIAIKVAAAINADAQASADVTAAAAGAVVTLTADVTGTGGAFTLTSSVTGITASTLAVADAETVAAAAATVVGAVPAVAIVPSATEANVVFYADSRTLYKSINGGDNFIPMVSVPNGALITALDVAKWGGRYIAVVGTDTGGGMTAGAYYWDESLPFNNLNPVGTTTFDYPVLAVALAPTFATDRALVAIGTDIAGDTTKVRVNVNGGAWGAVVADISFGSGDDATAADIAFFSDFNATISPIYFIAVSDADAADGGVYRMIGAVATRIDTGLIWNNLAINGSFASGTASLLVGSSVGTVKKSTNSGFSFSGVTLRSNVSATAWVLFDKDYATSKKAYVLNVGGAGGAFNVTVDSMTYFNQWSLVNDAITTILDLTIASNGDMFMATQNAGTGNSIWRFFGVADAKYWERTMYSATVVADAIRVSPAYATDKVVMYADLGSTTAISVSTNNANSFTAQPAAPGSTYGSANAISTLLVLGANSVVVGSTGGVITTSTNGYYWPEVTVTGLGDVESLARDAGTGHLLAAGIIGGATKIARSTDGGATWTVLATALTDITASPLAAFSATYATDNKVFVTGTAAGDAGVWAWTFGTSTVWTRVDATVFPTTNAAADVNAGDGIVTTPGGPGSTTEGSGMLYVTDGFTAAEGVSRIKGKQTTAEQMAGPVNVSFNGLWAVPASVGSVKLWTIGTGGTVSPAIYTYTDTLNVAGTGVAVSAVGTITATISWAPLANATSYRVGLDTVAQQTNFYTAGGVSPATYTTTSVAITGLTANTKYYVSVWANAPVSSFLFAGTIDFTTLPLPPVAQVGLVPLPGATNVPVMGPAFAWAPGVAGTIGYEFNLTTDPTPTSATDPTFANITEGSKSPTVAHLVWAGPLEYETAYYWQVRAVGTTGLKSAWVTSVFTTVAEPEPPVTVEPQPTPTIILPTPTVTVIPPDVSVTVVPPDITVDIPQPTITTIQTTIEMPEEITPAYIWAIVAIGALLVIAVITLIIRTRRVV